MPGSDRPSRRRVEGSRGKGHATGRAAAPAEGPAPRRRSRAATEEAILSAAERAFSTRGFNGASVREVAEHAGVTHALVHRYFGAKDDLYQSVLKRNEDAILDAATGIDDPTRAAALMVREGLAHHRPYLRLIVDSALRGVPFESSIVHFSATERLIELVLSVGPDERRPASASAGGVPAAGMHRRMAVALVVALFLGWASAGPWVLPATGLQDLDEEALTAGLERGVTMLLEGFLAPPAGPPTGRAE